MTCKTPPLSNFTNLPVVFWDFSRAAPLTQLLSGTALSNKTDIDALSVAQILEGTPAEVDLGMQLVSLVMREGRLDHAALARHATSLIRETEQAAMNLSRAANYHANLVLAAHDPRVGFVDPAQIRELAQQPELVEQWMQRLFTSAPLEISVMGDISLDDARSLVGRYFGDLPPRPDPRRVDTSSRVLSPYVGPLELTFSHPANMTQAQVIVAWSTPRGFPLNAETLADSRALLIGSRAIAETVNHNLRRDTGFTYSPFVHYESRRDYPGLSRLAVLFSTPMDDAKAAAEVARKTLLEAADTITDADVAAAVSQVVKGVAGAVQLPQFWGRTLRAFDGQLCNDLMLGTIISPQHPAGFPSVTTLSVRKALRNAIQENRFLQITVLPSPKTKP